MRKGILLAGLVLVLLVGMSTVWADDESTRKPGTPADNECYPGGVLYREENQDGCPTLWYWKAGWFLARFRRGFISRADFPKEFESVLPPEDKPAGPPCWSADYVSIQYTGPANQRGNIIAFPVAGCIGGGFAIPGGTSFVAFANSKPEAAALCATQGSVMFTEQLNSIGYYNAPMDAYACVVS